MKVAVIMGSISDKDIVKKCCDVLKSFDVCYDLKVISAHRSLDLAVDFVNNMEKENIDLIIAFAGKSAHLAGVLAGISITPVIGVPIKSNDLLGVDSLLSTVQMPKGVPVATVGINGAENAAILAVEILSLKYDYLKEKLKEYKIKMKENVIKMNKEVNL